MAAFASYNLAARNPQLCKGFLVLIMYKNKVDGLNDKNPDDISM